MCKNAEELANHFLIHPRKARDYDTSHSCYLAFYGFSIFW